MKMTDEQIQKLLNTKSEIEWNAVCDEIKQANDGNYPNDWYARVMLGGVAYQAQANWNN